MKKQILSLILAVVMFLQATPITALADTSYTVSFKINPSHAAMEEEFREWAATLVEYYRGYNYAALKPNSSSSNTVRIPTLERVWGDWEETEQLFSFDASVYAPYYKLAVQKSEFDASTDAAAQNVAGVVTRYTYYTAADLYADPDKATEIYEWLLIQTLKEKAELEPGFLTQTDYIQEGDKAGWYTFDVETGGMTYDSSLRMVDHQSYVKMIESIGHSFVSLVEVGYEGCKIYSEIKGKAADIAKDAAAKLNTTTINFDKLKEDFFEDMIDSLVETITATYDEAFTQISENIRNETQNIIRNQLAIELANQALTANKNVIGYLKAAYVDPDTMLDLVKTASSDHVKGFRDAAQKIIYTLESEEIRNAIYTDALAAVQEVTLSMASMEEVLPSEVIAYNILTFAVHQMVSETFSNLQALLSSMFDEAIEKKTSKGAQDYLKVVKEFVLTDLWNRFITSGVVDGMKKGFELHKPTEIAQDGVLGFAGNLLSDIGSKIMEGWDLDNFGDFLCNCFIDRGIEVISITFDDVAKEIKDTNKAKAEKDSDKPKAEKDSDKTEIEKVIESYSKGSVLDEREQDPTLMHVFIIVLGLAFSDYISDYKTVALRHTSFMSDVDKDALKGHLSSLEKTAGTLRQIKKIDKQAILKYGRDLLEDIATIFDWCISANARYQEDLFAALGDSFVSVYKHVDTSEMFAKVLDFISDIVKSGDLWNLLLYQLAEFDVEKSVENAEFVKAYADANPTDQRLQQYKITAQSVINFANTEKESSQSILGTYLGDFRDIITGIWDKAVAYADDFWIAWNDGKNSVTGENLVSLDASRLYITYKNSLTLERMLTKATIGGDRTTSYQARGPEGLDFFIKGGAVIDQNGSQGNYTTSFRLTMSAAEIRNPILTPDLSSIKALTDNILMQMELDLVGMGSYATLLKKENRDEFRDTRFYKNWLNIGILTTESYAEQCMIKIREGISYGDRYDHAWDALFE